METTLVKMSILLYFISSEFIQSGPTKRQKPVLGYLFFNRQENFIFEEGTFNNHIFRPSNSTLKRGRCSSPK